MDSLPIFLNIKQRDCLVVGGGQVAARKVALLKKAGSSITVISPELCDDLSAMAAANTITHIERNFEDADISNQAIIIASTDDRKVNERISAIATFLAAT